MYKVYGSAMSRANRVIWALEELNQPYELIKTAPRSEQAFALTPTGKIPILVDGDLTVWDSTSILTYLSDKHQALTFPVGSPERARLTSVICFATDEIEQSVWAASKHGFILPEDLRRLEEITPALHHDFDRAMKTLEILLGDGPFVMGEDFTIADIILGALGGWAKAIRFPEPPAKVADYMARVRSRPGWKKVAEMRKAGQ